ncbi:MAG: hypothetical protein ACTSWY_08840 [Promethearchaeota archaeon]
MPLNFTFEYYPKITNEILSDSITQIQENGKNWSNPFFMDVYSYTDLSSLKNTCQSFIKQNNLEELEHLIILGTGGSIQTLMALKGLLKIKFHPVVSSRPRELKHILNVCPPDKSVVIPISRGGKTIDVNSTLELFSNYPILALSSRGPMNDYLKEKAIPILPVPDLSGRYAASVCSVALVPAILGGIDVDLFLKNLSEAYSLFMDFGNIKENYAIIYATYLNNLYKKGFRNVFSMPYSSYLEGAVGLFVQEISESTGKNGKGLLGTSQPAPLSQHSVLELLLGGSKGHTTPLIWTTEKEPEDLKIINPKLGLENITALDVISHQADATFQALLTKGIPTTKIQMKQVRIENLAHIIAFIQSTVYFLCMLLNVNWESNPLVNTGKEICNKAIKEGKTSEQRLKIRENVAKKVFN